MKGRPSISAYTPSNTDPAILRRIFVQREKLFERVVDRLARSMTSGDKHHILLVGPRGSGKTHFVSLVEWELQQRQELKDKMRIAWLGEDDSFTGLIHLAFGIAKQLAQEYPDEFASDFKSGVRGLKPDDAALLVLQAVVEQLQNRSLILMTENMDLTFRGLGDSGRKKWRAFLQETKCIATLATSQQLFDGVSDRNEVFFGFFDIQHLEPLSVDEAQELICHISREQNKTDLVEFLKTPEGRYRIRALHYLAGGNHRMYVLLSEFLTNDSLEDLVTAFEDLANDMTPYFQERMRSLSDQQRQLAQCLCDTEGALTVKQIAEETFIEERSCSKQLGTLKSKGYVRSEKRGKESYYDMAEPLMRLCLEVKNQRGQPLKLLARFLRAWFPVTELYQRPREADRLLHVNNYLVLAAQSDSTFEKDIVRNLKSEIGEKISEGDYDAAAKLAKELNYIDEPQALAAEAKLGFLRGDPVYSMEKLTAIIDMANGSAELKAKALINRGLTFGLQGKYGLALADYTAVIEMPNASAEEKARALISRGFTHGKLGDMKLELRDYSSVVDMPDASKEQRADAHFSAGVRSWREQEFEESTIFMESALSLYSDTDEWRTNALFAVVEPMIEHHSRREITKVLKRAFVNGDPKLGSYGGTPRDLLWMVLRRSPTEWPAYISEIADLYVNHGVGEKLGQGVTQSIQYLDEGGFSPSQIEVWNLAWQSAGKNCEDLQIPLRCLQAAVAVMKSDHPTDQPLFKLPLEIRRLVRPLLAHSLGDSEPSG